MVANTETTIWTRVIDPQVGNLSPEAARSILRLQFHEIDLRRMSELSSLANEGGLSPDQEAEAEEYRRAADLLAILHSKARRSLRENAKSN
jgi:hypothetical protein